MLTTDLGRVLVTGGSGFVGANLVTELLGRGHDVRSFDRVPSPLPDHPRLQVVTGDISNVDDVAAAIGSGADAVDTVFHTAAIIDLMGGASVTDDAGVAPRTWCAPHGRQVPSDSSTPRPTAW